MSKITECANHGARLDVVCCLWISTQLIGEAALLLSLDVGTVADKMKNLHCRFGFHSPNKESWFRRYKSTSGSSQVRRCLDL